MNIFRAIICLFLFNYNLITAHKIITGPIITNLPRMIYSHGGVMQLGDGMMYYSLAKILSMKHNVAFCYSNFKYHDLFVFSDTEQSDLTYPLWSLKRKRMPIKNDADVKKNLDKRVILFTTLNTKIDYIDPKWVTELKKSFQFKQNPEVFQLPHDVITIGVHIRKGNGGGEHYDGEVLSLQEFEFDRSIVHYRTNFENYPFDWRNYERKNGWFIKDHDIKANRDKNFIDTMEWLHTKFPPNQYYVDQILKVSHDLGDRKLFVQIVTDDKNPRELVARIKERVNKSNIAFYYDDNRHLSRPDTIKADLYMLSRVDVLIRPESSFSRLAELIGNHKVVIYPFNYRWEKDKLIMTDIVINGSIQKLIS